MIGSDLVVLSSRHVAGSHFYNSFFRVDTGERSMLILGVRTVRLAA